MKVSFDWLQNLTELNIPIKELSPLLNSRIQGGVKEVTENYIELDLKGYNRSDLLSLRGVAYEVAALTDSTVKFTEPEESEYIWNLEKLPTTVVSVESKEVCPLYCIAKIEGLKVDLSRKDWVEKLRNCGIRSVNNVADITNLIMLEYGQPLHSFDANQVKNKTLVVRTANTGEEILTLDNKKRVLEPVDIVIADPEKAVGIAGVMGGKDSEVTEKTTCILLEAAIFDPTSIRRTATRLALPSEASRRFQHGLTKKRLFQALNAAIKMYQELGGKVTAISITGNSENKQKEIHLNHQHINSLIGLEITTKDIEDYLTKLNFKITPIDGGWKVIPPYYRLDIEIEADVIEEVARLYGYERIPSKEPDGQIPEKVDQKLFEFIYNLKEALAKNGLDEIQTYSFYSTKVIEALNISKEELIKIANPMSTETEYLRNSLTPTLIEKMGGNLKNFKTVGIFEVGKVYQIKENGPTEKYHLALALADGSENPLATLYSIFDNSCSHTECVESNSTNHVRRGGKLTLGDGPLEDYEKPLSHPNRFRSLLFKGQEVGFMSEVHLRITSKFGIEKRVAVLEISLEPFI